MVPRHEILSEDEVREVLERYEVDRSQLPKIKADDPVCIEIGAKVGDVVKVTRKSATAGEAVVYRLVI